MSLSNEFDPTEWRSAIWITKNLGVGAYRIKCLLVEGRLRTRLDHTRCYPVLYNIADIKTYLC
jgi:hypothetical protein